MPIDLFTDDLEAVANEQVFAAITEFAKTQPSEGWRHDYTEQWSDGSGLKNIAAFANTFGGLLIVGVRKRGKDVACELVGVESESEYKTRIASSIAANISPVPFYNVFECHKPDAPTTRFCVVRVRENKLLHLVTKRGVSPVYVRNEDEARPADAVQLRRLIEREREISALPGKISERADQLRDSLLINYGYQSDDTATWHLSVRQPSPTSLKLEMIPTETTLLELDKSHEDRLSNLIAELYPRVTETAAQGVARYAENRGAHFYEYAWYHKELDYEGRWRITSTGDIAHGTQMRCDFRGTHKAWSVVDLARSIILFAKLSMKWWQSIRYFGEGHLHVQLHVPDLTMQRTSAGHYTHCFDPTYSPRRPARSDLGIRADAILASASPGTLASAETKVHYFSSTDNLPRITTSVLNQLLRCLGHAVLWEPLQASVQHMVED
jgi:hypothetical protein